MRRQVYKNQFGQVLPGQNRWATDWSRLKERIVYLPGAVVLIYGLWLSLTV